MNNNLCGNIPNRICAGPDFISGCSGDDGGPVICNNRLFGLIDFTDAHYCSQTVAGRHTPYINIPDYHEWIVETIAASPVLDNDDGDASQIVFSVITLISSALLSIFFN